MDIEIDVNAESHATETYIALRADCWSARMRLHPGVPSAGIQNTEWRQNVMSENNKPVMA